MKKLKQTVGVFAICLIAFMHISMKSKTTIYSYVDGNNNVYTLMPSSLNYDPISKEESSSREYDGGEPKTVKITTEQFTKIEGIILNILADKTSHEKNREMGFGTVIAGKKTVYINRDSVLKTELENELKLCLK